MFRDDQLTEEARQVLLDNDRGSYSVPTKGLYPYQWNWDSAFASLGYATNDMNRAWIELESLFSGQWPNGMVPHILFHELSQDYFPNPSDWGAFGGPIPSSGISQPPVAPTVAKILWELDREVGHKRVEALLPAMLKWYQWFMDNRFQEGVIVATHPWESGRDNSPDWDKALSRIHVDAPLDYSRKDTLMVNEEMRPTKEEYDKYYWLVQLGRSTQWFESELKVKSPFRVGDPGLTFIFMRAIKDLIALSLEFGLETTQLEEDYNRLTEGTSYLWNSELEAYAARCTKTGQFADSMSSASFLCWYGGVDSQLMYNHLCRILKDVLFGIPSLDSRSTKFDRSRYWRGPTWAIMNFMIALGLKEYSYSEAEKLFEATKTMIKKGGFAEYFDPFTGDPKGGKHFTWTAAVWLYLAGRF